MNVAPARIERWPTAPWVPPAAADAAPSIEPLLPLAQVALLLGYTSSGFVAMVHRTKCIPIVRIGRRTMFRRSDVEALIARGSAKPYSRTK